MVLTIMRMEHLSPVERMFSMSLNNLKSVHLMLIVAFGNIYTFTLDPAPGFILDIKRLVVVSFVLLEIAHIAYAGGINKIWFILILIINIFFVLMLGVINSSWYDVVYQVLSLMFILSVFSHISRFTLVDAQYFFSILRKALMIIFWVFLLLLISYFVLGVSYSKRLIVFGFGNDYANFSVWLAYVSLLVTYLYVRFDFMKREYLYFQSVLLAVVALAGGRTGIIMIIGGLLVGWFYSRATKLNNFKVIMLMVSMVILVYLFGKDSMLLGRFFNLSGDLTFITLDTILSGRLTIGDAAINAFVDKYSDFQVILGMGLNKVYFEHLDVLYQVHNFALRSLMETGIVGLLLMLSMYLYPVFAKYSYRDKGFVVLLYLVASLNAMVSPASFFTNANISGGLWVLIGFAFHLDCMRREIACRFMASQRV